MVILPDGLLDEVPVVALCDGRFNVVFKSNEPPADGDSTRVIVVLVFAPQLR